MIPSSPVTTIPRKDNPKTIDIGGVKGRCEPISEIQNNQVCNMKTTNNKSSINLIPSQSTALIPEKVEERPPDKILRPIAPKPINVVCIPDILCMREVEADITEKHDALLKNSDERVIVKTGGAGPSTKSEKDNEDEIPALKKTSSTGRSPPKTVKKKPKQIRDLEKTLNCLLSDNDQVKDEKAFAFAQSYFLKVTETLHGKDDTTYHDFMKTMNEFGVTIFDASELYKKVEKIFEKYPNLSEEFLAFLLPEQAMQCGKFMEYLMITKMRNFCRKLELYYSKQPSQLRKIYSSLSTLASNNKATLDDLRNTILPLLRNNSLLVNMFLELMPTEAPHASSLTDYESMDFSSIDVQNPKPEDWFETVEVPPPGEDSMYGGEDCICTCHIPSEGKTRRRSVHCMSCGTKFIQGRVYIHSGSMLRPARVSFKEMRTKAIERLSVKNLKTRRKIDKNQPPHSGNKKNSSSKGETSASNAAGVTNKMPPTKAAKKASKAKSLNGNPKKPNKPLSPSKASHSKKLSNDKKIPKPPPRKSIKLLANNSENVSTSITSVKSHLVSSKKGISQTGKVSCKIDMKAPNKTTPQLPIEQIETARRTGRSAARNLTFSNDCGLKHTRRSSGSSSKGENANLHTTDILTKKSEVDLSSKSKDTLSMHISVESAKEGSNDKLSSQLSDEHIPCTKLEETPAAENLYKSSLQINTLKVKSEMVDTKDKCVTQLSGEDQRLNSSATHVDTCSNEISVASHSYPSADTAEQHSLVENVSPVKQNGEEDLNEGTELGQCIEESSSEDDTKVLNTSDTVSGSKCVLNCPYISSDDKSDDSSSDQFMEVADRERTADSNDIANTSQSEEEDITKEMMEFENSFENISSEDEKNVLDSEDFPYNSSSESDIDDNIQMDVEEDSCEGNEDWPSSSQNDNTDNVHIENNIFDKSKVNTIEASSSTPWTRDEDKIILRTFQSVTSSEFVFQKICNELPSRTADEVRLRFQTLMSFLQKMAGDQTSSSS